MRIVLHIDVTEAQGKKIAERYVQWARDRKIDFTSKKLEDCKTIEEVKEYAEKAKLLNQFGKEALLQYYDMQTLTAKIARARL